MPQCFIPEQSVEYLMGHGSVGITLDTYTHVGYEDVALEMLRVVNGG